MKKTKVLFIHHGSLYGGAPLSMLYTMQALEPYGYVFKIGLLHPSDDLKTFYESHGFEIIETSFINELNLYSANDTHFLRPNNIRSLYKVYKNKKEVILSMREVIKKHEIDLIHLNSVILNPLAEILLDINFPFIWHVREAPPTKHRDFRFKKIQKLLLRSLGVIFLSEAEQKSWINSNNHGIVVNNFVDFNTFNDKNIDYDQVRKKYSVDENDFVILYLGGFKTHKGPDILINALNILKTKYNINNIKCLMPDTLPNDKYLKFSFLYKIKELIKKIIYDRKNSDYPKLMRELIKEYQLNDVCITMPFNPYAIEMYAISNVVAFPATVPHFARPIIEAGSMRKPVIASDIPVVRDLVKQNITGLLVPLDPDSWSKAIYSLYIDKQKMSYLGNEGYIEAFKRFNADEQKKKILSLYNSILSS